MSEQEIDDLIAQFQRACARVVEEGDAALSRTTKERAILRNAIRAKLIEGEQWRSDFQATEATARKLDEQWERLRVLVNAEDDDEVEWGQMVDRVAEMKTQLITLAKLASPTPQFFNPLLAWEAEQLRDRILADAGVEVLK